MPVICLSSGKTYLITSGTSNILQYQRGQFNAVIKRRTYVGLLTRNCWWDCDLFNSLVLEDNCCRCAEGCCSCLVVDCLDSTSGVLLTKTSAYDDWRAEFLSAFSVVFLCNESTLPSSINYSTTVKSGRNYGFKIGKLSSALVAAGSIGNLLFYSLTSVVVSERLRRCGLGPSGSLYLRASITRFLLETISPTTSCLPRRALE